MDKYRARNYKEKEAREKAEAQRVHEDTHAKTAGKVMDDTGLTTGKRRRGEREGSNTLLDQVTNRVINKKMKIKR